MEVGESINFRACAVNVSVAAKTNEDSVQRRAALLTIRPTFFPTNKCTVLAKETRGKRWKQALCGDSTTYIAS